MMPTDKKPVPIDPAVLFRALDSSLPLALFPVRLEARFLPDEAPEEIVVRVFPDEIHADTHDPALTDTEFKLAFQYWDWIWRAAADPKAATEAREWLAGQLGPFRAIYVAWATRPEGDPPSRPTPAGIPLKPPLQLRKVDRRERAKPGVARLLPARWAAFVEVEEETRGPFWGTHPVSANLPITPALVELREGADARAFLDEQGLRWTHDLAAAEDAGMIIRIPIAELPERPSAGYHRLIVLGVAAGSDHADEVKGLIEAHRYTRGFDLLPPGTPTNVSEESPEGAGKTAVDSLFQAEFDRPGEPDPRKPIEPAIRKLDGPQQLFTARPSDAVAMVFGLAGETAADLATGANDAAPDLALAANRALWSATWGRYFTDPMSLVSDGSPALAREHLEFLRKWFTDYVRAEGPLPTLRVGRHPYGLLPVSALDRPEGDSQTDHLERVLLDIYDAWFDTDSVPVLDPDASDVPPARNEAAEQASDVGAIYGATPHIHELRLRAVEDTHRELTDLYSLRLGIVGLLCAIVPNDDGSYATPEELENHPWYEVFLRHKANAQGANGVDGQEHALRAMTEELDLPNMTGNDQQLLAAFSIVKYIDRLAVHHREEWPDEDEMITGDLLGIVSRHGARVGNAQRYLASLGARDELGTDRAPVLYTAAYAEAGSESPGGVLVWQGSNDEAAGDLAKWLERLRLDVSQWESGGRRRTYHFEEPASLLCQLLQSAAATVSRGDPASALRQGLTRLHHFVETQGSAAIPVLERLLRGTLGLAMYRVDAWMTSLASERLAVERVKKPSGLQVGGYGWLINVKSRRGRASQGHIHAPSLDQATTAAVLRSGWSAFGTREAGSPLAVNLSSQRVRAAKSLIEGVRSGQELGRLLGARFERRLHDRNLDRYIDDIRAAVLAGSGQEGRPPTRIVDGLLLGRAFTKGIEPTDVELAVFGKVDPIISASTELTRTVGETAGDLDAVADVLFAQAVHSLVSGDAGVAAPTLAATGSGDSGLPAIDFPQTLRGGRPITLRIVAVFAQDAPAGTWPGSGSSLLAVAEPRLESWAGSILGLPGNVAVDIAAGGATHRVDAGILAVGALDAIYSADRLHDQILKKSALGADAVVVSGRPSDLTGEQLSFDEFITLARSVRSLLGRIRPLTDSDFATLPGGAQSWNLTDLVDRIADAATLVPAGDPRHEQLAKHEATYPVPNAKQLIERLHILTVAPAPILPLVGAGIPEPVSQSFAARQVAPDMRLRMPAWLAQAAKVRPAVDALVSAAQMAELVQARSLLFLSQAQSPEVAGDPWVGLGEPSGAGAHTGWCSITGPPPEGPVAGFIVDSWTETIPARRGATGIAVHFDRPSAMAPNAVLLAVNRADASLDLNYVFRCVRDTLLMAQFRAMGPDTEHVFLGQFLPAVFLPGEAAILEARRGEQA